jgi:alpha-L-fucosidase
MGCTQQQYERIYQAKHFDINDPQIESVSEYEATRQSCAQHRQPEWFQDAKLGLYAHWGPRILAFEEAPYGGVNWDLEQAYEPGTDCNAWWNEYWGDPAVFGMKDVCQLFNPVNFDADEWAQLAVDAGAKFGGMYAGHRVNFSMFDDPGTIWNSVDTGMRKMDYQAALADAYRAKGLKVTVGHHFSEAWRIYTTVHEFGDGASAPELYTDYHTSYGTPMATNFKDSWVQKIKSSIDASDPDHIAMLAGEPMSKIEENYYWDIFSYFFNKKGNDGVMVCKGLTYDKIDDDNIALDNHEMGNYGTEIKSDVFEVDQTIGGWFYQTRMETLEFNWGIHRNPNKLRQLADIVSKNGVMLLNFCPKADGSIAEHVKTVLREMGDWLAVNGEAIYCTRPFYTHGEGPNKLSSTNNYTNATHLDMRFTQSKDGDTVYCILFDWPGNGSTVDIASMGSGVWDGKVRSVDMLPDDNNLKWHQTSNYLSVTVPSTCPSHDYMYVLRINLEPVSLFVADFNASSPKPRKRIGH